MNKILVNEIKDLSQDKVAKNICLKSDLQNLSSNLDFVSESDKLKPTLIHYETEMKNFELQNIHKGFSNSVYENTIEQLLGDNNTLKTEIVTLSQELNLEIEKLNSVKIKMSESDAILSETIKNVKLKEEDNKKIQEINRSLKQELERLQKNNTVKDGEYSTMHSRNAQLMAVIDKLADNIEGKARDIENCKKHEGFLQNKVIDLNRLHELSRKEIVDSKNLLVLKILNLEKEVKEKNDTVLSLNKTVEELKANVIISDQGNYKLSGENADLEDYVEDIKRENKEIDKKMFCPNDQLNVTNVENSEFKGSQVLSNDNITSVRDLANKSTEFNYQISGLIIENKMIDDQIVDQVVTIAETINESPSYLLTNVGNRGNVQFRENRYENQVSEAHEYQFIRDKDSLLKGRCNNLEKYLLDNNNATNFEYDNKFPKVEDTVNGLKFENQILRSQLAKYTDCLERTESILDKIQNSVNDEHVKWRLVLESSAQDCVQLAQAVNLLSEKIEEFKIKPASEVTDETLVSLNKSTLE